ncbi:MAG: hypothetical protein HY764_00610, partial [Candidatus Portnoybacteria bacterium]|nr:hypothetical protein [Candidatus Portnoybacteria bacterium]
MKKTLIKFSVCLFLFFILALPSEAAPLGQQVLFYVDSSFDSLSRSSLTATLQKESDKAYFYAENAWWDSLSSTQRVNAQTAITNLADEFDERIYPQLTGAFGSIWNPGIDGDPKVTILISRLRDGAAGYFNSADEYPRSLAPSSNQREMIYLGANYLSIPRAKGFLAHEFQHLITFYQKEKLRAVSEDIWLNEARSEYVSTLLGYDNVL